MEYVVNEQRTGCREGIELSCARCGQVVSCGGRDHTSIITELMVNDRLGFSDLLSALVVSSWEIKIAPRFVEGRTHVFLVGTPVDQYGCRRASRNEVLAAWERLTSGWTPREPLTGCWPSDGSGFQSLTSRELVRYVSDNPASWLRVAR